MAHEYFNADIQDIGNAADLRTGEWVESWCGNQDCEKSLIIASTTATAPNNVATGRNRDFFQWLLRGGISGRLIK
jgi:hypothetical protein